MTPWTTRAASAVELRVTRLSQIYKARQGTDLTEKGKQGKAN